MIQRGYPMQIDEFNTFKELTKKYGIIFFYSGYFTQNVIAAMGDALRAKLQAQVEVTPTVRKLFSTFIEMAQNIMHYSANTTSDPDKELSAEYRSGSIAIGREENKYVIICGNIVQRSSVDRLNDKLSAIHRMSKQEIKQAYKQKLLSEPDENSQGAGLGLLTVARDSVDPIEYSFIEQPDATKDYAFFYIKATIL